MAPRGVCNKGQLRASILGVKARSWAHTTPKLSDQIFAQHPAVRILGGCPEEIIESMGGGAPESDSGVEKLSNLRATYMTLPSSHCPIGWPWHPLLPL